MANGMMIEVVLSAYDKMSGAVKTAVTKSNASLNAFSKGSAAFADQSFKTGRQLITSGLSMAAPLVALTQSAMEFEDAMADVAKVANMDRTTQEFRDMSAEVLKTSKHLATSGDNVAQLYSSLLAGGTARAELSQVANIAGEAAVAFDMSQEAAGNAFMTMKNSLGISVSETKKAFDATNALTNKFGGKASEILDFMSSGGASVARTLKASAPEMEAFGRALMMSGVSASEAGTVMQRFRAGIYKNKEALDLFNTAGGGKEGMLAIFEQAQQSGDPFKWFQKHKFGEYASQMSLLAMNGDKLGQMLQFVGDEQNFLNSASQEFASRTSTTSFKLNQAKIAFQNVAIKAGTALLPTLTKLIAAVTPLIEKFSQWVEKNPELVATIAKTAATFSALSLAGGYLSFIVGGVAKFFSIASTAIMYMGKAFGFLFKAISFVSRLMLTNPILLAITAIVIATILIIKYWDKIKAWFAAFGAWFKKNWDIVLAIFFPFLGIPALIIRRWESIKKWFLDLLPFFKEGGKNIIMTITNGILSVAMAPVKALEKIGKKLRNLLPFSPAKEGPLKDLHRIKLVETIAGTVKPGPLLTAMKKVTGATVNLLNKPAAGGIQARPAYSNSSNINAHFNIHLNGGATKTDGILIANECKKQFAQMMQQYNNQQARVRF